MAVIARPLLHTTIRDSYTPGILGLSRDLRPSLHGALVVATVAMEITAPAETATREVGGAMRQWCVMATKGVDVQSKTLAPAQLLNSSPALRLGCGANEGASHAGLMEKPEGRGNADTDAREVGPSGVDTHK